MMQLPSSPANRSWDEIKSHFFPNPAEMLFLGKLPFIAYALDTQGVFLWYNQKCRDFFHLADQPDGQASILTFYNARQDREEFLTKLKRKADHQWLENSLLDFKLDDQHHYLKDYSRPVRQENGELIGLVSMMINVTSEERYHRLFENLSIGIFRFLKEEGLVYANEKFLRMHGYERLEDIQGAPVSQFVADRETARFLIDEVRREGKLEKQHVKHCCQNGTFFWGSIHASALYDDAGNYLGTEGTVVDVTMEELYSGLINLVPIGLFKVVINPQGEHIIEHCNDAFARNLDFQSFQELIGKDSRQFHDDFDGYYGKMVENDEKGLKNESILLTGPPGKGAKRKYQVYPRIERDSTGKIIGRVGAQRDVTQENELRRRLEEIQSDVGQVLHAYSTTLVMARTNFEAVLLALTSNKTHFEKETFQESVIFGEIDQSIRSIRSLVIRLKQEAGAAKPGLPPLPAMTEITRLTDLLREVAGLDAVNQYTATNSETAVRMIELLADSELVSQQPKERLRALRQALDELVRSTSIIFLHRGLEGVLEMDAPVNSLRSYLIDGIKVQEEKSRVDIYDLLLDVSKNLFSYAAYRGIEIKYHLRDIQNLYLSGHEAELRRAFTNLLHNAIKYSWTRKTGSLPYVDMDAKKENNWLIVTLVNRGVGISKKEIEEGRVFDFGYRGEHSGERRRPGTGIGLYDARKVIDGHGGTIQITSKHAHGNPDVEQPSQPYITTVTCKIPFN